MSLLTKVARLAGAVVTGALVAAAGQAPSAGAAATPGARAELLRQARASLASSPDLLRPSLLVDLAAAEARLHSAAGNKNAQSDLARAFQAALDLPGAASDDDSPLAELRAVAKSSPEQNAIYTVAATDPQRALAMAARADVDQFEAFTLALNGATQGPAHHDQPVRANVQEMVNACLAATGSVPYEGLQYIVISSRFPAASRESLIHEAFAASQNETDPRRLSSAAHFLVFAYDRVPGLGREMTEAAPSVLRNIAAATRKLSSGASAAERSQYSLLMRAGVHLLTALEAADPGNAADVRSNFPQFAATNPRTASARGALKTRFAVQAARAKAKTKAALAPISTGAPATRKFEHYRALAAANQRSDPAQALGYARKAASLLDNALLGQGRVPDEAAGLAHTLARLGDAATADSVLDRCLGYAQKEAADDDTDFAVASGGQRVAILNRLLSFKAGPGYLLQLAGETDWRLATEYAERWPALSRSEALIALASGPAPRRPH